MQNDLIRGISQEGGAGIIRICLYSSRILNKLLQGVFYVTLDKYLYLFVRDFIIHTIVVCDQVDTK